MSRLMGVKLRRDLRASWPRFALMVLAIAVSLTVFGGTLAAWAAVGRETSGAYMSTQPASATIVLRDGVAPERMAAVAAEVRERPAVLDAAGRGQFDGRISGRRQANAIPMQVFVAAPGDPMRLAKFGVPPGPGTWPLPAGDVLIRQDSLPLLGVAVGDAITLAGPGGEPVRLRVAGTVYDPSLAPSPQEQKGYAYLSTASLSAPAVDLLKIQVAAPGENVPSRDRGAIVAEAEEIGRWLQRDKGLAVQEIQVPAPYAHPHQWQSDALLGSLLAGSALALLLSAVLVATMLNTLFTQQIPQIGILKAIGARSSRVARLYLTMTLLVAATATALAIGPAVLIGRTQLESLLGMLGIQAANLAAPWWTYAVIMAVGLALPPLIALVPLVKTSRTTVRAAIDHHGGAAGARAAGLLARLRGLDRGLLMALRNTVRRPARFFLAVGLLAGAGTVFVAGMSLGTATEAVAEVEKAQRYWDVNVRLTEPAAPGEVAAAIGRVPDVTAFEGWNNAEVGIAALGRFPITRTYPDQGHGRITLDAVPMDSRMFAPPEMLEGRWLRPGETGAVVVSPKVLKSTLPGAKAGDRIRLFAGERSTAWRIAGIAENREGYGVYTTPEGFAAATGRPVRVGQVRLATAGHDEGTRLAVAGAAADALRGAGLTVQSANSVSRNEAVTSGHLGPIVAILVGVALPLGVIGAIGLASTMSTNVLERTREFGVMHAIGARPRTVRRIVVLEGVLLAVASCVVAVLPTLGLTALLDAGFGNLFMSGPLPFRISLTAVAIWTALAILGAALATEAAATRASRITVREALTYI